MNVWQLLNILIANGAKMTKIEQAKRIEELERLLAINEIITEKKPKTTSYSFSTTSYEKLRELMDISLNFDNSIFDDWFNSDLKLNDDVEPFLIQLLEQEAYILKYYNEEDLKMYFLSQIFNHIKFKMKDKNFRFFSKENLKYEADNFILNGTPDFFIAKGLDYPQKPYFFIQEFKQEKGSTDPEYQLLAELICGAELNDWRFIKGAYIRGIQWRFMILERFEKHKYQYFVSKSFDSSEINGLRAIYKNLIYVKNEVIEMIDRGE